MMTITKRDWQGAENLGAPGEGVIVAPNHLSWFDPIVLAHFLNDNDRAPRFLAKDSVFEIPLAGRILAGAGQIPVFRGTGNAANAVKAAVAAVAAGEAVVVYPEGTLTRDPKMWPMTGKTGAARIALTSGKPVIPVAHWGAQEIMSPYTKEFNAFPPKTMHVIAGSAVDLDDLRDAEVTVDVLAEATSRIMDDITELLAQLRNETAPTTRWDPRAKATAPIHHPIPKSADSPPKSRTHKPTKQSTQQSRQQEDS